MNAHNWATAYQAFIHLMAGGFILFAITEALFRNRKDSRKDDDKWPNR